MKKKTVVVLSAMLAMMLSTSAVFSASWADCTSSKNKAMSMLATVKRQTLVEHQSIDKDAFRNEFQQVMNELVAGSCMTEAQQVTQYVLNEQQQYPAPK